MTLSTLSDPDPLFTSRDSVLRQWLKLDAYETDEDGLIDTVVSEAVGQVETYTRRALLSRRLRLVLDGFGCGGIVLPIVPVSSVDAVSYVDGDGVTQTMAASDYRLVTSSPWPEVHPAYGSSWPTPRSDLDSVTVDFTAGYGAAASDVPAPLVAAVRHLVAYKMRHRGLVADAGLHELPLGARDMMAPFRNWV